MRESEFVALLSMVDEINKQIKKTKKIARKERQHSDDESDNNFTQVPSPPMQKKRPNKHPAPSIDSNGSSSCGKSQNLQRKRKQKKKKKNGERK